MLSLTQSHTSVWMVAMAIRIHSNSLRVKKHSAFVEADLICAARVASLFS